MKKIFLSLVAAFTIMAANATILRVSNLPGSSAPYTSISDAVEAAIPGDTVMVEGSPTNYATSGLTISKRIVLIGPGYNKITNGLVSEGFNPAYVSDITLQYNNIQMIGMTVLRSVNIDKANIVVTRCKVGRVALNGEDATGCIIHQNYITGNIEHGYWTGTPNVCITNNIMEESGLISNLRSNSYIAYNTFLKEKNSPVFEDITGCTIENNILPFDYTSDETNSSTNNYVFSETPYYDTSSEVAIRKGEQAFSNGIYGAFAGDDPYVISGVPAGPVIEDVTIPASIEQGQPLKVTIKLGIQK